MEKLLLRNYWIKIIVSIQWVLPVEMYKSYTSTSKEFMSETFPQRRKFDTVFH